jgi:hypothetical protein
MFKCLSRKRRRRDSESDRESSSSDEESKLEPPPRRSHDELEGAYLKTMDRYVRARDELRGFIEKGLEAKDDPAWQN